MKHQGFFRLLRATELLCIALLATWGSVARAQDDVPDWLWSERSALINRSTEALAAGHPVRAVGFAGAARETALSSAERLIAVHNLCLAFIAQSKRIAADTPCREAVRMSLDPDEDRVIRRRGALVVGAEPGMAEEQAFSLVRVVRLNIARAYSAHLVDHMSEDFSAAEVW